MKFIEPNQPTVATLTSSTIPESAVALWDSGTSYTAGQEARRFVDGAYRIYEALIDNSGQPPEDQPVNSDGNPYWLNKGPTDRWAMFSGSVNRVSVQSDGNDLVVEYTPGRAVNSLALFNAVGSEVTIDATSAMAGGSIFSETISTTGSRGPGYWRFYFGEVNTRTRFTFNGIPPYPDMVITVTITPRGGEAQIGELVYGTEFIVGTDELGMEPDLKSYSTNEFDPTFGYNVKVKRGSRRRLRSTVVVDEARSDIVFNKMQQMLDVNAVFFSDKYESGQLYGFCSEYKPVHSSHPLVFARMRIEGLI